MIPISGIAAKAGWSRNGSCYYAPMLKKLDGVSVPMLWNHIGSPEELTDPILEAYIIGHCTVYWVEESLRYVGLVKDEFRWCVEQAKGASIGLFHDSLFKPHVTGKMILVEVSLVMEPSIESSTINIIKSKSRVKVAFHVGA